MTRYVEFEKRKKKYFSKNGRNIAKWITTRDMTTALSRNPEKVDFWLEHARKNLGYKGHRSVVYRSLFEGTRAIRAGCAICLCLAGLLPAAFRSYVELKQFILEGIL